MDALALRGDEGRSTLRKVPGSCEQTLIRKCPNGETHLLLNDVTEVTMFYVYVLQDIGKREEFYIGYASDLRKRLQEHNDGKSASTKGGHWRIVYHEAYLTEKTARRREYKLKHSGSSRALLMKRISQSLTEE